MDRPTRSQFLSGAQFSLISIMVLVALVALSIAAVRNAAPATLTAILGLMIGGFLMATLGARYGRGPTRDFGFGFALFSAVTFLIFFGGWRAITRPGRPAVWLRTYLPISPIVVSVVEHMDPQRPPPANMVEDYYDRQLTDDATEGPVLTTEICYGVIALWASTFGGSICVALGQTRKTPPS